MKPRAVLAVTNDMVTDQRVHRMALTLVAMGLAVTVVGRVLPHSPPITGRPYSVHRFKLLFRRGKLFYIEYNIRLLCYLLAQKAALLWANDLDTLGPCWLVATLKRLPLVYDSHEYFTEVPELQGRPLTRAVWLALERLIAPRLRYFITVTDAIAAEYRRRYGAPILTVRNVPLRREALPCAQRGAVLIYQGALNKGRGVEFLLQTMPLLPGVELWLAGAGDRVPELKRLHAELDLGARVRFLGRIPLEELPAITAQARIGLSLEEELGLSYRYGMPNKLFDYIQQHLPVIVSPLAEMAALVRRYDVGIVLEERTPQALATAVRTLLEDDTRYTHYAANAARAAEALCWEQEQEKVRALVRQALPSHEVC